SYKYLYEGRTLDNVDTATLSGGLLILQGDALFNNLAGATFDLQGDFTISASQNDAIFNNLGTFVKTAGGGTAYLYPAFNNSGTVNGQAGILGLYGGGSSSGAFQSSGANTLEFGSGTHTLTNASTVSGNVRVSGGTVEVNGDYDATSTTITNGTLNLNAASASTTTYTQSGGNRGGTGDLTVTGLLTWTGGFMRGVGHTIADGGLSLSGTGYKYLYEGHILDNAEMATLSEGLLVLQGDAVFNNLTDATFDIQGDYTISASQNDATFNNAGTFIKSAGDSISYMYPAFTNSGSVSVVSGELRFNGGFSQSATGVLHVQIGGLTPITDYDQFIVTGQATLDGTLNVTLMGGFVPEPGDSFEVMTFNSRNGEFATVNGNGQDYIVNYTNTDVTLIAE
ncbi:MAG: hypothetical protein ACRDIB_16460, partial [Ardenticatenaceae bacterium]